MEADLFTPQDAAALASIRAENACQAMSLAELLAAFDARGLLREAVVAPVRTPRQGSPAQAGAARR